MRGFPPTLWPSPLQEELLRVAFGPDAEARAAWSRAHETLDLDHLEDGSYALLPLLYRRLADWQLDDPVVARLKGLYRHTWYRNNVLLERLREVFETAAAAKIDVLLAGEPRLLLRDYGDVGLRPSSRIDLLARPDDAASLAHMLGPRGWTTVAGHGRLGSRTLWLERADSPTVALQRRLLPERAPHEVEAQPWEHAAAVDVDGSARAALDATDQLLMTCIGEERRFPWNRVQWIADAKLLLDVEATTVDWGRAFETAERYAGRLRLRDALVYAGEIAGARVPTNVLEHAEAVRPTVREALAHRWSRVDRASLLDRIPASARAKIRTFRRRR